MSSFPDLICPLCRSEVEKSESSYSCTSCNKSYPIFHGIPDFRIEVESWLDYDEDLRIATALFDKFDSMSFRQLHIYGQSQHDYAPEELLEHRVSQDMVKVERSRERMSGLGLFNGKSEGVFLDVGCGTGALLAAASESFSGVVGIDVCMEGLVISKKRFEERGLSFPMICGCVDRLPFRDDSFDFVASDDVIEHTSSATVMVDECTRVTKEGGTFFFTTPNRFTLGLEPHVFVWGVGFVPRRYAEKYVALFTPKPYKFTRLLSVFDIRRLLDSTGMLDYKIVLPDITATEMQGFSAFKKGIVHVYQFIKKLFAIRTVFYIFGPFFQVICKKKAGTSR